MEIPSFLYAAVDPETTEMAQELNLLGGGDATIFDFETHCFVRASPKLVKSEPRILWRYEKSIGLRDLKFPINHPINEALLTFSVTRTYNLDDVLEDHDNLPLIK
jgi:hypothetical protein